MTNDLLSPSALYLVGMLAAWAGLLGILGLVARRIGKPVKPRNRVDCAWCGITLKGGVEPVTHSICAECFETQERAIPRKERL